MGLGLNDFECLRTGVGDAAPLLPLVVDAGDVDLGHFVDERRVPAQAGFHHAVERAQRYADFRYAGARNSRRHLDFVQYVIHRLCVAGHYVLDDQSEL